MLSEWEIVSEVAREAARRITRKVISDLRQMTDTMPGDDSELKTTWDEICVQVQDEKSFHWDAYDETVQAIVRDYIDKLPKHEQEAIWLQTDAGLDWRFAEPDEREPQPVKDNDSVDWLTGEYVYGEADNWSNARIRAFLERSRKRD